MVLFPWIFEQVMDCNDVIFYNKLQYVVCTMDEATTEWIYIIVLPPKNKENLFLVEECAAAIMARVIGSTHERGANVTI